MNFLKFPYLVQMEILQQMVYSELFLLSLTSKKTTQLISSVRHNELKRIIYCPRFDFLHIYTKNENGEKIDILRMFPKKSVDEEKIVQIEVDGTTCRLIRYDENFVNFPIVSNEPPIDYELRAQWWDRWKIPKYPDLVFSSDEYEDEYVKSIHNQLNTIFGHESLKYELKIATDLPGFLPKFIKFSRSKLDFFSAVISNFIDAEQWNSWFDSQSKQDFVKIDARPLIGHLNTNSSISKADTLIIGSLLNFEIVAELLINIKNRAVFLDCVYSKNEDIIQFVKRWKSKNHHLELETLRVYLHRFDMFIGEGQDDRIDPFNIELIKNDAGLKEFPFAAQTIPLYPRSIYPTVARFPLDRSFTLSSYIVRDDGIVALASITKKCFALEVQKFTEDEMLAGATQISLGN